MTRWLTTDTAAICATAGWWILPVVLLGGCLWGLMVVALA